MNEIKSYSTFWLFCISIFTCIYLPIYVQQGMFLDGLTYATISRNLSISQGSFTTPHYTNTLYNSFFEHPPLVMIIQSFFFEIFGDHFYTEKIFCIFNLLMTAIGIIFIWNQTFQNKKIKKLSFIPLILFFTIPVVIWTYQNNMLENTLCIFTLFSTLFYIKYAQNNNIVNALIGSIFLACSFLSKGLVGLFPLAVPFCYVMFFYSEKKIYSSFSKSVTILLMTILIFFILFKIFPELKQNITSYIYIQLIPALNNKREVTTGNRFDIIFKLILELAIPISIFLYIKIKSKFQSNININNTIFFLSIAITASIPLIVSLKQNKYYLTPSLPFYIMAICSYLSPHFNVLIEKVNHLVFKKANYVLMSIISISCIFSICFFKKFNRDESKQNDITKIKTIVPLGSDISANYDMNEDWIVHAYMNRLGLYSLDMKNKNKYYITYKTITPNSSEKYNQIKINLINYSLYEKAEN